MGWIYKKESSMAKKSTTRYGRTLLVLLSATRARRRTMMITNKSCILIEYVKIVS